MQQHSKFKLFVGQPSASDPLAGIGKQVSEFVAENKVSAKSIGTEYIERRKTLVVTLGYREGEDSRPVRLQAVKLQGDSKDLAALEQQMGEASSKLSGIICHELFITEAGEFYMVFMTEQ